MSEYIGVKCDMQTKTSLSLLHFMCTGNVGFWNVDAGDEEENVHLYNPHSSVVAALQYAPGDNTKMYSWSYDGTVRCMDVVKQEFTRMFAISEDAHGWMQHGFISEVCESAQFG